MRRFSDSENLYNIQWCLQQKFKPIYEYIASVFQKYTYLLLISFFMY